MKITGRALYLRWNEDDRDRWSALPAKSKGKWEALAEMYDGGLSRNVTQMVEERLDAVPLPRWHHDRDEDDRPTRGFSESIDVTDRVEGDSEWSTERPTETVFDDQIFEKASTFLQEAVDEALRDPEFRDLVTKMLLDRVAATAEIDVHAPPVTKNESEQVLLDSQDSRAWVLK